MWVLKVTNVNRVNVSEEKKEDVKNLHGSFFFSSSLLLRPRLRFSPFFPFSTLKFCFFPLLQQPGGCSLRLQQARRKGQVVAGLVSGVVWLCMYLGFVN